MDKKGKKDLLIVASLVLLVTPLSPIVIIGWIIAAFSHFNNNVDSETTNIKHAEKPTLAPDVHPTESNLIKINQIPTYKIEKIIEISFFKNIFDLLERYGSFLNQETVFKDNQQLTILEVINGRVLKVKEPNGRILQLGINDVLFDKMLLEDFLNNAERKILGASSLMNPTPVNRPYPAVYGKYKNHCWGCRQELSSDTDDKCPKCGWLICGCGKCGCDYRYGEYID